MNVCNIDHCYSIAIYCIDDLAILDGYLLYFSDTEYYGLSNCINVMVKLYKRDYFSLITDEVFYFKITIQCQMLIVNIKYMNIKTKWKITFSMKNVCWSVLLILRCWQHQIPSQVTQHSSIMFFNLKIVKKFRSIASNYN